MKMSTKTTPYSTVVHNTVSNITTGHSSPNPENNKCELGWESDFR